MCSLECLSASLPQSHIHMSVCEGRTSFLSGCGVQQGDSGTAPEVTTFCWNQVCRSLWVSVCVWVSVCACVCPCSACIPVQLSTSWLLWTPSEHTSFQTSHSIDYRKFFSDIKETRCAYCSWAFIHKLLNSSGPDKPEYGQLPPSLLQHSHSGRFHWSIETPDN